MIRIELIGCTGAGKSTLVGQVRERLAAQGLASTTGYDLVLSGLRLGWLRGRLARGLAVNLLAIGAALLAWPRHRSLYRLVARVLRQMPASAGWFERLYIGRDVLKNIGIDLIVRRASGAAVVLLDEGPLHTAHYLFVNLAGAPDLALLAEFARLAPLPDLVVYLRQPAPVLIERTLARGHKRIPAGSRAAVELFIGRAVQVFDLLASAGPVAGRLLAVGSAEAPAADAGQAAAIVCAAIQRQLAAELPAAIAVGEPLEH